MNSCVGYSKVESFCVTENSVFYIAECMYYIGYLAGDISFFVFRCVYRSCKYECCTPGKGPTIFRDFKHHPENLTVRILW